MAPVYERGGKTRAHRRGLERKEQNKGDLARLGYIPEMEAQAHALAAEKELQRLNREYKDRIKREAEEAAAADAVAGDMAVPAAAGAADAAAAAAAEAPDAE